MTHVDARFLMVVQDFPKFNSDVTKYIYTVKNINKNTDVLCHIG